LRCRLRGRTLLLRLFEAWLHLLLTSFRVLAMKTQADALELTRDPVICWDQRQSDLA
jgi:hypothetical protein